MEMDGKILPSKKDNIDRQSELTSVKYLKGVGPQRERLLNRLGIKTVKDLLYYFPRAYIDRSVLPSFNEVRPDKELISILGRVQGIKETRSRPRLLITKVTLTDSTGFMQAVWFNQPYISRLLRPGMQILVTGRVVRGYPHGYEIQVREYEIINEEVSGVAGINKFIPIYATTEGLPVRVLRNLVSEALKNYHEKIEETLPAEISKRYSLMSRSSALKQIHFPANHQMLQAARKRLCFEELFFFQLRLAYTQAKRLNQIGFAHQITPHALNSFRQSLNFSLTAAQDRVLKEIIQDMMQPFAMYRLLQGDVGSGKTVLAAAALFFTVKNGLQGALMVPTEVLAEQHYRTLKELFCPFEISVALLKGGQSRQERKIIEEGLKEGLIQVVVGTQALIQENIEFRHLGLVVVDEQHRFGVKQRAKLLGKGKVPDVLVMTATPIPRTLALTLYGDLDISTLDVLPPGRKAVKTYVINDTYRTRLYRFIREQVCKGRQAYFICPLIEESKKLDFEAAKSLYAKLKNKIFPDLCLGLIHGQLRKEEKEKVMNSFVQGDIHILVSTTVIEVGIDVPNATIMVIEDAERFGLSQLHQLRGRVGRGEHQAYCILISNSYSEEARQRLKVIAKTNDGFAIAEEDLKLRGPGEFLGIKQHGLPDFKLVDLSKDLKLLELARKEARRLIKDEFSFKNQGDVDSVNLKGYFS